MGQGVWHRPKMASFAPPRRLEARILHGRQGRRDLGRIRELGKDGPLYLTALARTGRCDGVPSGAIVPRHLSTDNVFEHPNSDSTG